MTLRFKNDPDLDRLDRILNFDFSGATPSIAYLTPAGTSQAWIMAAVLATPVILWILIKKRRFGWLIFFFFFVLAPWIASIYFLGGGNYGFIFSFLPILFLYVYLFLLKQTYKDWREPIFRNKHGSGFK